MTASEQVDEIIHDEIVPIMQELLNRAQQRLRRHKIVYMGIDEYGVLFSCKPSSFSIFGMLFNDSINRKIRGSVPRKGYQYAERFPELVEFSKIARLINYTSSMSPDEVPNNG